MADRTSARVFAEMLELVLAPIPGETPRDMAIRILQLSDGYDFSLDQMNSDDLLAKHDLVRQRWHSQWKEWETLYAHEDGFDAAQPFDPNREDSNE